MKKKTVKAWAVLYGISDSHGSFDIKINRQSARWSCAYDKESGYPEAQVVRCTITYTLPTTTRSPKVK